MKTDAQLRAHVMRRVYMIYWGRQIARPLPRMAAFALLALALTSSVSVVSVIINALSVGGVYEVALFFVSAFVNTTLFVQAVVAGIAGSIAWFSADTIKKVYTALSPDTDLEVGVAPAQY